MICQAAARAAKKSDGAFVVETKPATDSSASSASSGSDCEGLTAAEGPHDRKRHHRCACKHERKERKHRDGKDSSKKGRDSRKGHGRGSRKDGDSIKSSERPARVTFDYPTFSFSGMDKSAWPRNITHLYLDGNNMLCACSLFLGRASCLPFSLVLR